LLRRPLRLGPWPATRVLSRPYVVGPAPPSLTPGEKQLYDKLLGPLEPSALTVQDVSGGCGDFYHVSVSSKVFRGMPLIKQHRLVQTILKDQIQDFHGIQVKTSADE